MSTIDVLLDHSADTGWDLDTLLYLACEYIDNQRNPEGFADFVAQKARQDQLDGAGCGAKTAPITEEGSSRDPRHSTPPETVYLLIEIHDGDPDDVRTEVFGAEEPALGPALTTSEGLTFWYGAPVVPIGPGLFRYLDPEPGTQAYVVALDRSKAGSL